MEHLWRYKIGLTPPITGNALVQETVRGGLFHFYSGVAVSPLEGVQSQWRDRLSGWGDCQELRTARPRLLQSQTELPKTSWTASFR